jgi:hypothetical protein
MTDIEKDSGSDYELYWHDSNKIDAALFRKPSDFIVNEVWGKEIKFSTFKTYFAIY